MKVLRCSVSPYQDSSFFELEKERLESLGVSYTTKYERGENYNILITNTHTKFDELDINLDAVKLVIHPNSGSDNFPFEFVQKAGFPIVTGNEIRAQAVYEYIMGALLGHFCKIPNHKEWHTERTWHRFLLSTKKIQIIGLGMIGKKVSETLKVMGADVAIYDPFKNHFDLHLKEADAIVVAASLNKTSRHLLNAEVFYKTSPDLLLINPARGEIVKTEDLVEFLKNNSGAFAYLDVFEKEPNDFSQFKDLNNIVTTSHIAGVSSFLNLSILEFEKKIIGDFLSMTAVEFQKKHGQKMLQNRLHLDFII